MKKANKRPRPNQKLKQARRRENKAYLSSIKPNIPTEGDFSIADLEAKMGKKLPLNLRSLLDKVKTMRKLSAPTEETVANETVEVKEHPNQDVVSVSVTKDLEYSGTRGVTA